MLALLVITTPITDEDPDDAIAEALDDAGVRGEDRGDSGRGEDPDEQVWRCWYELVTDDPHHVETRVRAFLHKRGTVVTRLKMTSGLVESPQSGAPGTDYNLANGTLIVDPGVGLNISFTHGAEGIVGTVAYDVAGGWEEAVLTNLRTIVIRPR